MGTLRSFGVKLYTLAPSVFSDCVFSVFQQAQEKLTLSSSSPANLAPCTCRVSWPVSRSTAAKPEATV